MRVPANASTLVDAHERVAEWHFSDDDPGGETPETPEHGPDGEGGVGEEADPDGDGLGDVDAADVDIGPDLDAADDGDGASDTGDGDGLSLSFAEDYTGDAEDGSELGLADDGDHETDSVWEDTAHDRDARLREEEADPDHREVRSHVRTHNIVEELSNRLSRLGQRQAEATSDRGELLDMRNVVRRLSGDMRVDDYWRREVTQPGERIAVGLSLDMSGSMATDELDAKAAAGAFLFAVEQAGGEVVANAWKDWAGEAEVYLITNPWEPFQWRHLDTTDASGGTPTARGVYEAGLLLEETRLDEKLLLVITDGRPSTVSRDIGATGAATETKETIEELRNRGLTVLGIGIGNVSEDQLANLFGEEQARKTDLDGLADTLTDCYEAHYEAQGERRPNARATI